MKFMIKIVKVKYMRRNHKNQLNMVKVGGNYSPLFTIDADHFDLRARAVFVSIYEKVS
jgi:hypothetical protein